MKQNTKKHSHLTVYRSQPAYPNAADSSYFAGKALNILTAIVSGLGFVSAMVFLVAVV